MVQWQLVEWSFTWYNGATQSKYIHNLYIVLNKGVNTEEDLYSGVKVHLHTNLYTG